MSDDLLRLITPLLASPSLLETEEGEDSLDVICMQFVSTGEAIKRIEKIKPGLLADASPQIDWKGAMGFRDVIAHQYFDLDSEQVLLICRDALPGMLAAIHSLERTIQAGETEGRKTEGPQTEQMGLGL